MITDPLLRAYRWHRDNPVGAVAAERAAVIAYAAAKAELVARDRGWVFTWVNEDDESGWSCRAQDAVGTILAAIGGICDEDEADDRLTRAWEAAVAVDACWAELLDVGEVQ